jgi:DNA (cytosine-5)-methyltransferase 1
MVRGAAEIDPDALSAHKSNFPSTVHLDTDVTTLTGEMLRSSLESGDGYLAGIIGGSPCQGFSCIGRHHRNDRRNALFAEFFRVVAEALPKFFLAENVPGIMRERNARIREIAFSLVQDRYTILPPMVLAANRYGAPTVRTRVFFFGYLPDEIEALTLESFAPPEGVESVRVGDALRGLPTRVSPKWQTGEQGWRVVHAYGKGGFYADRLHGRVPSGVGNQVALKRLRNESRASGSLGTVHSEEVAQRYARIEPGKRDPVSKSHRLDPGGFCPTLRAGTGRDRGSFQAVRPLHPKENRVITPREAARLQGFPDWFQFSPTKWQSFRQIGGSVSPIIAERILRVIRRALGDG